MPGKHCKGERVKKHVYSESQRRLFYAVASGKAKTATTMTPTQARHHIEMGKKEKGNLPERTSKRRTAIRQALKRKK